MLTRYSYFFLVSAEEFRRVNAPQTNFPSLSDRGALALLSIYYHAHVLRSGLASGFIEKG